MDKVGARDQSRSFCLTNISAAHGGLLVSVTVSAVQQHFQITHPKYNHVNTFNVKTVFLRPAAAGEAVVEIDDVKLGANISTVHFALPQGSKQRVVGYAS